MHAAERSNHAWLKRLDLDIGVEGGRLVVAPRTRPSYTLHELLAQCDDNGPVDDEDRSWLHAPPVGSELL